MRNNVVELQLGNVLSARSLKAPRATVIEGVVWVTQANGLDHIYRAGECFPVDKNTVFETLSNCAKISF